MDHADAPSFPPELAALVERDYARAVRVAGRLMGGDWASANDVVHDALVLAAERLGSFRGEAKLRTWFFRILTHTAISKHRRTSVRRRLQHMLGGPTTELSVDPEPHLRERLLAELGSLTDRQRRVFVLVALEEFSLDEAAAIVGCAPGTARSHYHRALTSLRDTLGDLWTETTDD